MSRFEFLKIGVTSAASILALVGSAWAQSGKFPDITGTWTGEYRAAFAKNHPVYPDQALDTEVELEVYRQEENLLWVVKRWRRGGGDWVEEYGVGSFDVDDPDEFVIVEESPPPQGWINTGFLTGEYEDGELHFVCAGAGSGVSYSVSLKPKR